MAITNAEFWEFVKDIEYRGDYRAGAKFVRDNYDFYKRRDLQKHFHKFNNRMWKQYSEPKHVALLHKHSMSDSTFIDATAYTVALGEYGYNKVLKDPKLFDKFLKTFYPVSFYESFDYVFIEDIDEI
jgi:hypothetical protein